MRWVKRLLGALLFLVAIAAGVGFAALRASLPVYDGEFSLRGLQARVTVSRDARGAVDIQAGNELDAFRALGFVHGQERFFEMDLTRRMAAGELSELFGPAALAIDREHRLHRFRARAKAVYDALDEHGRARVGAYVEGVNAGLNALAARPFPYLLLRKSPRPWAIDDCALIGWAMFFDLQQSSNARELALDRMLQALPEPYVKFLNTQGSAWDAPIAGEALPDPSIPGPDIVDLRPLDRQLFGKETALGGDLGIGSNNFGVSGKLTDTGAALIANDMHLGLRVPNIWFQARIRFTRDDGDEVDLAGVTLPGVPLLVAGSNRHIAWAFTNSYGDWLDWVKVEWTDPAHRHYRVPEGEEQIQEYEEVIEVSGGQPDKLLVLETRWGPIAHEDDDGALALSWTAHREGGLNFDQMRLENARTVNEALDIANVCGVPAQNFLVGDSEGHLAWTIIGRIPRRVGVDPLRAGPRSAPGTGWAGWLTPEEYPRVINPEGNRLWTANARVVGGEDFAKIGDGGFALGARAQQIRDDLRSRDHFQPSDMLAIQLDDRTVFLKRWWQLLHDHLARHGDDASLAELKRLTETFDDHASIDAVSYRLVRAWRLVVMESVMDGLAAPMRAHDPTFQLPALSHNEAVVWTILHQQPAHLLPPIFDSWDALLQHAAHRVVDELGAGKGGLAARTWGERNTSKIQHPLSRAVPLLSRFLDMPSRALPGDTAMPRVQGPSFGASERFAVSPGHEEQGYFHMPGGQSGHPLSPYYGAAHAAWENGEMTPFLPGPAEHILTLGTR